jgi:hypothetical protein
MGDDKVEEYAEVKICPFNMIIWSDTHYAWGDINHLHPITETHSKPMICSGVGCMKYDIKTKTCKRTK